MKKILIVEDEEVTALALEGLLVRWGYEVTQCVNSYTSALDALKRERPDLILCDIVIDGFRSGIDVARDAVFLFGIPTLFLTAFRTQDVLHEVKSVDYVGFLLKPYNPDELQVVLELTFAKIALTKKSPLPNPKKLHLGKWVFDSDKQILLDGEKEIRLSPKATKLISFLGQSPNTLIPYETLHANIYGENEPLDVDKLRHLVHRVRGVLGKDVLHSVKNVGYSLRTQEAGCS